MDKNRKSFEYEITVIPEHLDAMDHVNNVVFVQFMQDIAIKHWSSVKDADLDAQTLWVVRKHEIEYLSPAFLHDQLLIRTWTGKHTAVTWNRHCEITRVSDQKRIISSVSNWVLVDRQTSRPRRITASLLSRFD